MYSDNQSRDGNEGYLRRDFHKLSLSEKVKMLNRLHSLLIDYLGEQALQQQSAPTPTPEPAPIVEEAPQYDVTAKQRRRLAAFDDMTDADQLDQLKAMWGES
jgi:hypothetical protein